MKASKSELKSFLKQSIEDKSWESRFHVTWQKHIPLDSVLKMIDEGVEEYFEEQKLNVRKVSG